MKFKVRRRATMDGGLSNSKFRLSVYRNNGILTGLYDFGLKELYDLKNDVDRTIKEVEAWE